MRKVFGGYQMFKQVLLAMRPAEACFKNLIVFAGLLFSKNLFEIDLFARTFLAFILFCLISGSVYIINDLLDIEEDRVHPHKSRRPIASGRLTPSFALMAAVLVGVISLVGSFLLNFSLGLVVLFYFLLMIIYSLFLEKIVVVEVLVIPLGFILRAIGGTRVIGVELSSWLLVCCVFLALFVALGKRRHDLVILNTAKGPKIYQAYSPPLLDQMLTMSTACLVLTYVLYTMAEGTVAKFGTNNLIFTLPFVLYGIFRFLYLVYREGKGGGLEGMLTDRPLITCFILWGTSVVVIIYLR